MKYCPWCRRGERASDITEKWQQQGDLPVIGGCPLAKRLAMRITGVVVVFYIVAVSTGVLRGMFETENLQFVVSGVRGHRVCLSGREHDR